MTKASDNIFPKVLTSLNTSDQSAPSDSSWKLYAKAGGIYARSSNAVVGPFVSAGYEYDYVQLTSGNVSITATTEGTANTIVTANAVTYDGATSIMVEFFCPFGATPAGNINIIFVLYDSGSSIGKWGQVTGPDAANIARSPVRLTRRLTPTFGSHTYSVRAYVDSGTGTVNNGAGGSGAYMPLFIRQTRV